MAVEEFEDEGACYAFEVGEDRLFFLHGQQYYDSTKFPSLDFSIVHVLDEDERWLTNGSRNEERGPI